MPATRRKQLGAWYTPPALVAALLEATLDAVVATAPAGGTIRVLDPACGDGRFLAAARERIERAGRRAALTGVDVDRSAVRSARATLGPDARLVVADALTRRWGEERFDVVVGNPPFLSQLAAATARGGRSVHGGGPYADAAVEFLALAHHLARPDGGRVGLVLPVSIVATRDAGTVREAVLDGSAVSWFWWSPTPVFDAQVRTCAVAIVRGAAGARGPRRIRRAVGPDISTAEPVRSDDFRRSVADTGSWSLLMRDRGGPPDLPPLATSGRTLSDVAAVTADFRDQYYGLVGAVGDDCDGPPLVTSGLIDPCECRWGQRPTRFARQQFAAPRVAIEDLAPTIRTWAARRLVPKVVVASQTRIIEAVADPDGAWLPCVPVVSVVPRLPDDVWALTAVLTSPVASAWLAARSTGSGLSAGALRVSAPVLAALPLPAGDLEVAASLAIAGDVESCGRAVCAAYGLDSRAAGPIVEWWLSGARARSG